MKEQILAIYEQATPEEVSIGRGWYAVALQTCREIAVRFDADLQRVVWAVAVLSPRISWEINLRAVQDVLKGRRVRAGAYTANIRKAQTIIAEGRLELLRGPKVRAFAEAIYGDEDAVVVDVWTWRAYVGRLDGVPSSTPVPPRQQRAIVQAFRELAHELGLQARQLQAIVWLAIRRLAGAPSANGQLTFEL